MFSRSRLRRFAPPMPPMPMPAMFIFSLGGTFRGPPSTWRGTIAPAAAPANNAAACRNWRRDRVADMAGLLGGERQRIAVHYSGRHGAPSMTDAPPGTSGRDGWEGQKPGRLLSRRGQSHYRRRKSGQSPSCSWVAATAAVRRRARRRRPRWPTPSRRHRVAGPRRRSDRSRRAGRTRDRPPTASRAEAHRYPGQEADRGFPEVSKIGRPRIATPPRAGGRGNGQPRFGTGRSSWRTAGEDGSRAMLAVGRTAAPTLQGCSPRLQSPASTGRAAGCVLPPAERLPATNARRPRGAVLQAPDAAAVNTKRQVRRPSPAAARNHRATSTRSRSAQLPQRTRYSPSVAKRQSHLLAFRAVQCAEQVA